MYSGKIAVPPGGGGIGKNLVKVGKGAVFTQFIQGD
jgi:hypothetical protein